MFGAAELVVDVGHSRIKWARCSADQLVTSSVASCPLEDSGPLLDTIRGQSISRLAWSPQSHHAVVNQLRDAFRALGVSCRTVSIGALNLPVAPAYSDLGTDRWLALQSPWTQSQRAICVVDCGTAVTVDAVDASGCHLGGWIMAGLSTLSQGLGLTAPRLPAPHSEDPITTGPATDSALAIGRGLKLQLIGGVRHALLELEAALGPDFDCWLTGGDAPLLANALGRPVRQDPNLVLRGLALAGSRS